MVFKVLSLAFLVACTQAINYDGHGATSSVVFNDNHNTVQHVQSAYAAPSHGYSAPSYGYAAPAAQYSHAAPVSYAVPAVKVAAPVLYKSAAPSHGQASSYSSLSFGQDSHYGSQGYSAPTYAAPAVTKFIAPVAKVVAAPAYHGNSYSSYAGPSYQGNSYSSYPGPASYAAPAVTKYVTPVAKVVAAPAYYQAPSYQHEEENYGPAKYDFAYGVEDHQTGDIHSHKESREGDVTHGEYSLHEADGTIRTVKYSVDKHSGFNAVVERSGHAGHAQPAKAIYAAPVLKAIAAPANYYHH